MMDRLPNDLILEIVSCLDVDNFLSYQAVNRTIHDVI